MTQCGILFNNKPWQKGRGSEGSGEGGRGEKKAKKMQCGAVDNGLLWNMITMGKISQDGN